MTTIKINKISSDGKKTQKVSLSVPFDNLKLNGDSISQVVNSYLANRRSSTSNTKTRREVAGTGKKPYKQKGTGYARFGSLRTPIHRGGGIAFGPKKIKNYHQKISKKLKKKALAVILEAKNNENLVFSVSDINIKKPNTKEALSIISKFPIKDGNALILTEKNNKNLYLSFRNVSSVDIKEISNLNMLDLLTHDNIIFTGDSHKLIFSQNTESSKVKDKNK